MSCVAGIGTISLRGSRLAKMVIYLVCLQHVASNVLQSRDTTGG